MYEFRYASNTNQVIIKNTEDKKGIVLNLVGQVSADFLKKLVEKSNQSQETKTTEADNG